MRSFKYKAVLQVSVIILMLIFEEAWCGPVGKKSSEVRDVEHKIFKRFSPSFFSYFINHPTGESKYTNFIDPGQNDDYDYTISEEKMNEPNFQNTGNGDFVFPWFHLINGEYFNTMNNNKKPTVQPLRTNNNRQEKKINYFETDDEEDYDSDEDYENFNLKNTDSSSNRHHFGHNHGYNNHGFGHHHGIFHNHGFQQDHNPGCLFPIGDGNRRRPSPGPPRPPPGPPRPPPGPPLPPVPPPTSNPPNIPPITSSPTTAVSIDPRASTSRGSIVSTEIPDIDIRFG